MAGYAYGNCPSLRLLSESWQTEVSSIVDKSFIPPVAEWTEVNALSYLLSLDEGPRADAALDLFLETQHRPALLRDAWRMTYAHKPAFLYDRFDLNHDSAPEALAARIREMESDRIVWGDDPLRAFLLAADFPRITDLGDTVTIWRGLVSAWEPGRLDLAWTLDRDTAAWFAMQRADIRGAEPTVIKLDVPALSLLWRSNERGEAEVIPRLREGAYEPETVGTPNEIKQWAVSGEEMRQEFKAKKAAEKASAQAQ